MFAMQFRCSIYSVRRVDLETQTKKQFSPYEIPRLFHVVATKNLKIRFRGSLRLLTQVIDEFRLINYNFFPFF